MVNNVNEGVIWGHWNGSKLTTSNDLDVSHPELKPKTLQQAFDFNDEPGNWKAWQIKDDGEVIVERLILWAVHLLVRNSQKAIFSSICLQSEKGIPRS